MDLSGLLVQAVSSKFINIGKKEIGAMSEEGEKKKVLIVDDEPNVVRYLEMLLQDSGYKTVSALDGQKALEVAERETPALVILDVLMPEHTGTDFFRKLRKNKILGSIPIIVVSAAAGRNLVVKKPAAIFNKPIDPETFIAAVKKALNE